MPTCRHGIRSCIDGVLEHFGVARGRGIDRNRAGRGKAVYLPKVMASMNSEWSWVRQGTCGPEIEGKQNGPTQCTKGDKFHRKTIKFVLREMYFKCGHMRTYEISHVHWGISFVNSFAYSLHQNMGWMKGTQDREPSLKSKKFITSEKEKMIQVNRRPKTVGYHADPLQAQNVFSIHMSFLSSNGTHGSKAALHGVGNGKSAISKVEAI